VLRAKGPSSRSVLDCGSPLPAFLTLTIHQSPITIHAPCAARDRTLSSSLFAGSYAIGLSPFDVSSLTSGASRYPFAFPIHLKFNSINLVRGLYRKERTDHGRQPASVVLSVVPKPDSRVRLAEDSPSTTDAAKPKFLDRVRWHLRVKRYRYVKASLTCRKQI